MSTPAPDNAVHLTRTNSVGPVGIASAVVFVALFLAGYRLGRGDVYLRLLSWEHFEKPLVERGHRWQYQP